MISYRNRLVEMLRHRLVPMIIAFCLAAGCAAGYAYGLYAKYSSELSEYRNAVSRYDAAVAERSAEKETVPVEESEPEPETMVCYVSTEQVMITRITHRQEVTTVITSKSESHDGNVKTTETQTVSPDTVNPEWVELPDASQAQMYAATFTAYLESQEVLERILETAKLSISGDALSQALTVSSVNGSCIFDVTVEYSDAFTASRLSSAAAQVLLEDVESVFSMNYTRTLGTTASEYESTVVSGDAAQRNDMEESSVASEPTSTEAASLEAPVAPEAPPSPFVMALISLASGVVAALLCLALCELFGSHLYGAGQTADLAGKEEAVPLATPTDMEGLRIVRGEILSDSEEPSVILMASDNAETDIAAMTHALARTFAIAGRSVLVVDGVSPMPEPIAPEEPEIKPEEPEDPIVTEFREQFGAPDEEEPDEIVHGEDGVDTLYMGLEKGVGSDIYLHPAFSEACSAWREGYEIVLMAGHPLRDGSDSAAMSNVCDAVLLVSIKGVSKKSDLAGAMSVLQGRSFDFLNLFAYAKR